MYSVIAPNGMGDVLTQKEKYVISYLCRSLTKVEKSIPPRNASY